MTRAARHQVAITRLHGNWLAGFSSNLPVESNSVIAISRKLEMSAGQHPGVHERGGLLRRDRPTSAFLKRERISLLPTFTSVSIQSRSIAVESRQFSRVESFSLKCHSFFFFFFASFDVSISRSMISFYTSQVGRIRKNFSCSAVIIKFKLKKYRGKCYCENKHDLLSNKSISIEGNIIDKKKSGSKLRKPGSAKLC